ncbi:MAG TPA: hypothetical protein DCL41_00470 [Bdellovibrionales bacterium]|nr:hypothetical protein [Pseudobdellovibrionaceae bacterium]HAG90310.1 hypothetical protein [Bdellovibrionales bacterium]|tara:strand:- start:4269 stop:4706 length:438 start_codon:yes stop_codon:yes gene_type:complete
MIETGQNKKEAKREVEKVDRIPLTNRSSQIVSQTIDKMLEKHPGVSMNRKDFVNWLIEESFKSLTPSTEKVLYERFYDEIKFLEKSLRALKKKKKNGEDVSIAKVLKQAKPKFKKTEGKTETSNKPKAPAKPLEKENLTPQRANA